MLSEDELLAFCERHGVTESGCEWIKKIRSNPPSRRVRAGRKNISCRYPSVKMGHIVQAESHTIELSAIYLMEHDNSVLEYWDQPNPKIDLLYKNHGGRTVRTQYTPDFFVISEGFVGFEEWKPLEELYALEKKQAARYRSEGGKFFSQPVEDSLEGTGISFRIRTDADFNPVLVSNLKFLSYYLQRDIKNRDFKWIQTKLRSTLSAQNYVSMKKFIETVGNDKVDLIYEALISEAFYVNLQMGDLADSSGVKVFESEKTAKVYYEVLENAKGGEKVLGDLSAKILNAASPEDFQCQHHN